ncbi:MAG: LPS export ABC transporter periplasmic protein LptC [Janthinobacterium lividum]
MDNGSASGAAGSRTKVRRVARLRRWLLGGVVLLLLVLASLLGYARFRAHRFLADIPRRLGIDIKSETNGFTYSQSSKGHTLFTVHAAKAVQRENGKTTLHDVAITLYGPQGSNRTDSIRGEEFEYDQPNGVVRATGDVHLDLAAPLANGAAAKPGAKRITVTTRGLVLLQKLGVAATDQPIQILYGDLHGSATGAEYENDTGVLRLRNDVRLDGTQNGEAIHVDATAAELDRTAQLATLHSAHLHANGSTSSGDRMVFALAKDGGIQAVDAEGNVHLQGDGGSQAAAPHMHVTMSATNKPQQAVMHGGVTLKDKENSASAADAQVQFNAAGQPQTVVLQHAIRVDAPGHGGTAGSTLTAGKLVAQLIQNGRRSELRDAVASDGAEFRNVGAVPAKPLVAGSRATTRTTVMDAATLHAVTAVADGVRYVATIDGSGNTKIDESDDLGNRRTSSGDTLQAVLLPHVEGAAHGGTAALKTMVQTGHVSITQHTVDASTSVGATTAKQTGDSHATASRAEFDGASQKLLLTGSPMVTAPGVQLAAERITLLQSSGDANAEGTVRGTLVPENSGSAGDPVHVVADHATIAGANGLARFFAGEKPARMWTSTAQLQAAELDLDRGKGTLAATGGSKAVQLVLPAAAGSGKAAGASGKTRESGAVQVTGREMLMTATTLQEPGHIDFRDDVRVVSAGSDLRANHVVATLKPAATPEGPQKKNPVSAMNGGSIESILATGDVRLQQPGRTGTGDRLLYTESDGRYLLTGTPAAPPTIVDSLRGSVTGSSLIFHGGDDSVEVAGEAGKRVHTETHAARPARGR